MSKTDTLVENEIVDYNIAYAHFKLKEYKKAGDKFQSYIGAKPNDINRINDSHLRLGDVYFVSSEYSNAIKTYNKVIEANGIDTDYAHFQRAMSYGLTNKNNDKILDLTKFLSLYPKSTFRDDAYYELGNSYVSAAKNDEAIEAYTNLLKYHKRSSYVPKALLKQGLIYYNTERDNQALDKYKRVVKEYPNTDVNTTPKLNASKRVF